VCGIAIYLLPWRDKVKRRQILASIQTVSKNKYRKKYVMKTNGKKQNGLLLECINDSMKSLLA
jgi:hypothetical protein